MSSQDIKKVFKFPLDGKQRFRFVFRSIDELALRLRIVIVARENMLPVGNDFERVNSLDYVICRVSWVLLFAGEL